MALQIYGHPLSSYCWKVLIALYEAETPFELLMLDADHPAHTTDLAAKWPLAKMPVLLDGTDWIAESSIIIEYLDLHHAGRGALVPARGDQALRVRFLDRVFDNYVMAPVGRIVADRLGEHGLRPSLLAEQRDLLDRSYAWLDAGAIRHPWATGDAFTLADCAGAPALFYADKVHPLGARFPAVRAYLDRLLERPGVARAIAGARPWWHMFPFAGGPPDGAAG